MKPVSFVRTSLKKGKDNTSSTSTVCASCRYSLEDTIEHSLSDGYKNPLSLDTLLVQHPAATYFLEVGNKDESATIQENPFLGVMAGDILTIDRALSPTLGKLVLAVYEGSFTLCRFTEHDGKQFLVCGEGKCVAQEVSDIDGVYVWGVVSALSRRL